MTIQEAHKNLTQFLLNARITMEGQPLTGMEFNSLMVAERTLFDRANEAGKLDNILKNMELEKLARTIEEEVGSDEVSTMKEEEKVVVPEEMRPD